MKKNKFNLLSIAGFDPSAGAGILADIKTSESCNSYGMGVTTAITYQNDLDFEYVDWLTFEQITHQINILKQRFEFDFIKIGLIENLDVLEKLISYLILNFPSAKIVWDPILKATAGFEFYKNDNQQLLEKICKKIYLITPNIPEAQDLGTNNDAIKNVSHLSNFCNVYLKGGHQETLKGTDILFLKNGETKNFTTDSQNIYPKHGSGCVLSSAITAYLSQNESLEKACEKAKRYITTFLKSNDTLLGTHTKLTTVEHV